MTVKMGDDSGEPMVRAAAGTGPLSAEAGAASPDPAWPDPARRSGRRRLSIQGSFTLIAAINALVLGYLLLQSVQLLRASQGTNADLLLNLLLTVLLSVLALLSFLIIRRRIIEPIRRLLQESNQIQRDQSQGLFSTRGNDEISGLARGFNRVLLAMRRAMDDLDRSHRDLMAAQHQITESLHYAGIFQQAILPGRELEECFGGEHYVIWMPRDRVGGDFYLVHRQDGQVLVGVADCAGHGVAGAMMTMLARAGVDRAIQALGIESPAALLTRTDRELRALLGEAEGSRALATSMDIALVLIDPAQRRLRFAGARLGLCWSDGRMFDQLRGGNRSLGEGRPGTYHDQDLPLNPEATYTLCTDGMIDQCGGADGFCLGRERLEQWLKTVAPLPLGEQRDQLHDQLMRFRGEEPQRDDITLLAFRPPSRHP